MNKENLESEIRTSKELSDKQIYKMAFWKGFELYATLFLKFPSTVAKVKRSRKEKFEFDTRMLEDKAYAAKKINYLGAGLITGGLCMIAQPIIGVYLASHYNELFLATPLVTNAISGGVEIYKGIVHHNKNKNKDNASIKGE